MKNIKKEKAITLISLVLTIIILIILAGVSINLILGESGIINKTKEAKEKTEIATYIENIKLELIQKQLEKMDKITQSDIESILSKYGEINKEDDKIKSITTDKGYEISYENIINGLTIKNEEKEEIVETIDIIPTITIANEDIWTNTAKQVEISTHEKYKIKYTIDGTEPTENNGIIYEGPFEVSSNCMVKAAYYYAESTNKIGESVSKEVSKIDKVNPIIMTEIYSCLANDFSKWSLIEGAYISNNQLVLPVTGVNGYSHFYYVQGKKWWVEGKAYTSGLSNYFGANGGLLSSIAYYDKDKQVKEANSNGLSNNGWAISIPLNKWTTFQFGARNDKDEFDPNSYGFGENTQYLKLGFAVESNYSSPTTIYSDIRVYTKGEISDYSKIIEVSITEDNGVKTKKYLSGTKTIQDFANSGIEFDKKIEVMENGVYTIYVEDIAGNKMVETIQITGITKN